MARIRRIVPKAKNPYYSNVLGGASITVGAEGSNIINLAIVLKSANGDAVAERVHVPGYFSSDANGAVPLPSFGMPSGGYAIGTNGTIRMGPKPDDALFTKGTLLIHSTPEQFKTTTTASFLAGGVPATKAAATGLTFSAAHVVSATKFGFILIMVDKAGAVTTKVPAVTATTPMTYASAALALAAGLALTPDAGKAVLGYIAIAAGAGAWTANTDDMTNGSDLTTAAFVDAPENGQYSPTFDLFSTAAGLVDVNVTETRIKSLYLNLEMPDGSFVRSAVIAFA